MAAIRFIVTGGTIDKKYDDITGNLSFASTHIPRILEQGRCNGPSIAFQVVMLKDSQEMTDEDRMVVSAACTVATESRLIITHGTDTVVETAQCLANTIANKTIVLVGSMLPWSFGNSDASFNLGVAIGSVQLLPPGVYVAMNGSVFNWNQVRKNKSFGYFAAKLMAEVTPTAAQQVAQPDPDKPGD